jgi:hypothetical protein
MKGSILSAAMAFSIAPLLLSAPYANADFIHKNFTCPATNRVVVPTGTRFDIEDIVISTNKDQAVTLKFNPGNRILMKLFMKAKVNFSTNFSGSVDGENEQGLNLDCSGTANTTVSVTVTGNGNL